MKQLDYILANETEVLNFLKSQYPLYHLSNIFFRDIQYGIQTMLDRKNMSVGYAEAEKIAKAFVAQLEKKRILNPIDKQSWVMNFPDFKKPAAKPSAPAKPAAKPAVSAAAAPGTARPSLPPLGRPAAGAAKPGGLPPLGRPAAGAAKLPPLSRPAAAATTPAPAPVAAPPQQAETSASAGAPVATETPKAAATPPPLPAPKAVPPGGRKPLPPLRSSAGKK